MKPSVSSPHTAAPDAESGGTEGLQADFREVMAGVATPVSVVTAISDGTPHGTTVSAFASLSMDPPMVLVALDRGSDLLALIRSSRRFGVNVLGAAQSAIALAFARKGEGKFAGVRWDYDHGLPRLHRTPGWLACELTDLVDGGDHVIGLGRVVAAQTCDDRPLVYHARVFGTHSAIEELINEAEAGESGGDTGVATEEER